MNNKNCAIYVEGYDLAKQINYLSRHNIDNFGEFINSFLELDTSEIVFKDFDKRKGTFVAETSNNKRVDLIIENDCLGISIANVTNYYYLVSDEDFLKVDPKIIKRVYTGNINLEREYNSYWHKFVLEENKDNIFSNKKNIVLYIEKPFSEKETYLTNELNFTNDLLSMSIESNIESIFNLLKKYLGDITKYPKLLINCYEGTKFNKNLDNSTDYLLLENGNIKKLKITKIKDSKKYIVSDDDGHYSYTCINLNETEIKEDEIRESIKFLKRTKD